MAAMEIRKSYEERLQDSSECRAEIEIEKLDRKEEDFEDEAICQTQSAHLTNRILSGVFFIYAVFMASKCCEFCSQ